ncbi:hypothetical protein [Streptomyces sp. MP131-18]|uniref:hypothetical protein n=1 Tax=Streptomyces sp. MP131-18 TaxID=1857892 RepID=UPI0009C8C7E6|nr:hypothetical protein [Streptomyces sp. MP131-18]ONK14696.1 hypothetical protein STBA_54840 [Streptomyces sp. MP131-18]
MKAILQPFVEAARAFGHGIKAANAIRHNVTPDRATANATAWTLPRPQAEHARWGPTR